MKVMVDIFIYIFEKIKKIFNVCFDMNLYIIHPFFRGLNLDPPLTDSKRAEMEKNIEYPGVKDMLKNDNLRLVLDYMNKKNLLEYSDADDIFQTGVLGLIKAVDTFDPVKNIKLGTYAWRCIGNEINMYFRRENKYSNLSYFEDDIFNDPEGNVKTLGETIGVIDYEQEQVEVQGEVEKVIQASKEVLSPKELIVINRYYSDETETSRDKIADELEIAPHSVSVIKRRALDKMRPKIEGELSDYMEDEKC